MRFGNYETAQTGPDEHSVKGPSGPGRTIEVIGTFRSKEAAEFFARAAAAIPEDAEGNDNTPTDAGSVSVEPSEEIREYCRMMVEFAPDVESGDETFEDVFESMLDMFRQHGRDVLKRVLP